MCKIKATELKIGNLVLYKGHEVALQAEDFAQLEDDIERGIITPITLTDQRLKDFEFEYSKEYGTWYKGMFDIIPQVTKGFVINAKYYCKVFFYVHQIQNLYFDLTGKEINQKTK